MEMSRKEREESKEWIMREKNTTTVIKDFSEIPWGTLNEIYKGLRDEQHFANTWEFLKAEMENDYLGLKEVKNMTWVIVNRYENDTADETAGQIISVYFLPLYLQRVFAEHTQRETEKVKKHIIDVLHLSNY